MFFTAEWLQKILSWQDQQTGCYKGQTITESQVGKNILDGHFKTCFQYNYADRYLMYIHILFFIQNYII